MGRGEPSLPVRRMQLSGLRSVTIRAFLWDAGFDLPCLPQIPDRLCFQLARRFRHLTASPQSAEAALVPCPCERALKIQLLRKLTCRNAC
jgi:hypothetical protein